MTRLCVLLPLFLAAGAAQPPSPAGPASVRELVARYTQSISDADTTLARQLWAERDDISFIHPLGHERGWEQIRSNLYERLMGGRFSRRKLTAGTMDIQILGDAAIVEFYWTFDATWRKDGKPFHSEGRETQVLARDATGAWRIVHVHYSGMPPAVPAAGL